MIYLTFIASLLLAGCSAAPSDESVIVLKESLFKDDYVIYTGKHDIMRIFVPLFQFNYDTKPVVAVDQSSSSSSSEEIKFPSTLFFVEGDYQNYDINQGLYVFKDGKATKLLNNGRDAIATQTNTIYFGAEDGIYKYDNVTNTATKYGKVTDSISQLAYDNKTNSIYYLTDDNEVYRLNKDVTSSISSVKVAGLTNVQEIAIGYEGWLYYYDSDKVFYVVKFEEGGVPKKITGFPANMNNVVLMAPFHGLERGVIVYADKYFYSVEGDRYVKIPLEIEASVTSLSPQPVSFHFYGKDKKIYVFNIRALVTSGVIKGV